MFTVTRAPSLPKLGWVAQLSNGHWDTVVGPKVEIGPAEDRWFEGAWAGPFDDWGFADCASVFGSGGQLQTSGSVRFTGPSHPQEGISVIRRGESVTVANSIVLALWKSGTRIDSDDAGNTLAMIRVVDGLGGIPIRVALRGGGTLEFYLVSDVIVDNDTTVAMVPKPALAPFDSFESYTAMLGDELRATLDNANAHARVTTFSCVASISSGYDSPACAAFAVANGCTTAFSIDRAKEGDDSGREIGALLGLDVNERGPASAATVTDDEFALFHADGYHGEDMSWATCRDLLADHVVVTGFNGDRIWTRNSKPRGAFTRAEVSGNSLAMLRITDGWIHLPLPFIGEARHESVAAITNSHDMDPWSVGGKYDRPIPRRIGEDAGIPRALFGQAKRGVSVNEFRSQTRVVPALKAAQGSRGAMRRATRRVRIAGWKVGMWCRSSQGRIARRSRNAIDRVAPGWSALDIRLLEHRHPNNLDLWVWACDTQLAKLPDPESARREGVK
jgi:hypothetical protein